MFYGAIKNCDVANGDGVRVALFVSGCTNRCKGCFQPETWDFHYGEPFTKLTADKIEELLAPDYINGLSLLGGDPMEPKNQFALWPFIKKVKEDFPNKTIWCYTGFTLDKLLEDGSYCRCAATDDLLKRIDVLVDGPFIEEQKDISLRFRGSRNQRIIDMNKTREQMKVVLWNDGKERD